MEHEFGYISQAIDVINEVATEFNGKVLNVRFWKAIEARLAEKIGTRHVKYDDGTLSRPINIVSFTKSMTNSNASFYLFDRGFSLPSDSWRAVYIDSDTSYKVLYFAEDIVLDKRISAQKVRETLEAFNNDKRKTLAKYKDALQNWDAYLNEVQAVNKYIREHIANINPLFIDESVKNLDGYLIHFMCKEF